MADVEIEAELQQYLAEHNIEHLLKDIVVKLCLEKPDNPLKFLRGFLSELEAKSKGTATIAEEDEEEEESEPKPRRATGNRRGGVSADVIDNDDAINYEKKVVPKDAATMLSLQKCVAGNVLFAHLEPEELTDVLDAMFLVKKSAGEVIMKQGDDGDNFYCIDQGVVDIFISKDGGPSNHFGEIAAGGSFGELALIYGTPRAATIQAKTDVVLWAIDRDTYRRILMGSVMRRRQLYEDFLAGMPLFEGRDRWERLAIADALEPAFFKDGDVIMRQGDAADCFYIVVEGNVVVTRTDDKGASHVVNELGAGKYFGEMAIIKNDARAATVTAKGAIKLAKMDRARFERLLGPVEGEMLENMKKYKAAPSS